MSGEQERPRGSVLGDVVLEGVSPASELGPENCASEPCVARSYRPLHDHRLFSKALDPAGGHDRPSLADLASIGASASQLSTSVGAYVDPSAAHYQTSTIEAAAGIHRVACARVVIREVQARGMGAGGQTAK